ncbi:hypothetical protein C8R44DRAFT_866777 [Mycena epipterygia]|nr:hypothetical protein C8R44DRAFT_866777 [Mycena epipterygia]
MDAAAAHALNTIIIDHGLAFPPDVRAELLAAMVGVRRSFDRILPCVPSVTRIRSAAHYQPIVRPSITSHLTKTFLQQSQDRPWSFPILPYPLHLPEPRLPECGPTAASADNHATPPHRSSCRRRRRERPPTANTDAAPVPPAASSRAPSVEAIKKDPPRKSTRIGAAPCLGLDPQRGVGRRAVRGWQLAVNHIAPFLLTKLVLPKLLAAGTAGSMPRVVYVASTAHREFSAGWIKDFKMLEHPVAENYAPLTTYAQSKSADILTAIELSKRSQGKINAHSLHPGDIVTNIIQKDGNKAVLLAAGILTADGLPNKEIREWETIAQGAATTVAAAFDTRLDDKPGAFLCDCVEANEKVVPHSSDPANAEKLSTITEQLIGEKFTF